MSRVIAAIVVVALSLAHGEAQVAFADSPAVPGYPNADRLRVELEKIARSPHARLRSLAQTGEGRDIWLLTLGGTKPDTRPGVLILAGLDASRLYGTRLALDIARTLIDEADQAANDAPPLLDRLTVYVIPLAAPDAAARFFLKPYSDQATNFRPHDDDGDGRVDEDPPNDLNGDGWITQMRIEDAGGEFIEHPDQPRLMIKADPARGERGRWRILSEGIDDDGDRQWNEDPVGGVAFNRNWPFQYPYFEQGAGEHQLCEPASRAVADWLAGRANLTAVFTVGPGENLFHAPPAEPSGKQGKIKTKLLAADASYLKHLGKLYREAHGGSEAPKADAGRGAFSDWAYFHMGRWSLASRAWWVPKVEAKSDDTQSKPADAAEDGEADDKTADKTSDENADENDNAGDDKSDADESKPDKKDDRAADQQNLLRWLEREGIDGFVAWTAVEHPDFPGRRVEVGGFKPLVTTNPPVDQIEPLAERHVEFFRQFTEMLPSLALIDARAARLDARVWRIEATVVNRGLLPTMPEMGRVNGWPQPVQVELELPKGVELVTGHARRRVKRLTADDRSEQTWLVRLPPEAAPATLTLRAWSPSVGEVKRSVELESR